MEDSRIGSYVGGKRGQVIFLLIWQALWWVDWGRMYETAIFNGYVRAVDALHPYTPTLNLRGIAFVEYATVYFYVLVGAGPLYAIFCLVASCMHFRASSHARKVSLSVWLLAMNLVLFCAMNLGLFYLLYLDPEGIGVPAFAADSRYYFAGFGLFLVFAWGLSLFIALYISLCFAYRLRGRFMKAGDKGLH